MKKLLKKIARLLTIASLLVKLLRKILEFFE